MFETDGSYRLLSTDRRGRYTISANDRSVLLTWTTDPFTEELLVLEDGSLLMSGRAFVEIGMRSPAPFLAAHLLPQPDAEIPAPTPLQSYEFEIDTGKMPNYGTITLQGCQVRLIHKGYGGNVLSDEVREFDSQEEAEDYYHSTILSNDPYYSPPSHTEPVYLELSDDHSHKFYEVSVQGLAVMIRYGRIGTAGQTSSTTYSSPKKAEAEAEKKINEKLKKGYDITTIAPPPQPEPDLDIAQFIRPAWKPVVIEGDGDRLASKFCGRPWLAEDETWPTCPNCAQPMQLFFQLNLAELPEPVREEFGTGLLQMFHCIPGDCQPEGEYGTIYYGREPYLIKNVIIRLVQPLGNGSTPPLPEIDGQEYGIDFPAKTITDWVEIEDYPHPDDLVALVYGWDQVTNCDRGNELAGRLGCEQYDEVYPTDEGDKLGGYPRWVQDMECPGCPVCHAPMRQVFQLASCDNLPYMFGDMGIAHVLQCKTHKDQFAFVWAGC
ncbi:WGR domain-containing protein [Nodularia sp. UHCC 0506]|uniref:WGR domain-containing protein n=1 Tax=Nodularia sp. UHCC 0506 TaxID=3110243 RepID=UPI002B21720C|nr:WGR domain-containing protein [Nodularia sp. UHCC 0506]MEA5515412.1 WGR domain-containing protein [Nodularia sp. UHCC 0506]